MKMINIDITFYMQVLTIVNNYTPMIIYTNRNFKYFLYKKMLEQNKRKFNNKIDNA